MTDPKLIAALLAAALLQAGQAVGVDLPADVVPRVNVKVEVTDLDSGEVTHQETHNLVTDAGLNLLRDAMNTGSTSAITHFAVGTGAAAVVAGDTTLGTEVFRDALTSKVSTTSKTLILQYYLGSLSANGNTLTEAGLFTAAVAGTCYARVLLTSAIVKTTSVAVAFTWTLTWGAA